MNTPTYEIKVYDLENPKMTGAWRLIKSSSWHNPDDIKLEIQFSHEMKTLRYFLGIFCIGYKTRRELTWVTEYGIEIVETYTFQCESESTKEIQRVLNTKILKGFNKF